MTDRPARVVALPVRSHWQQYTRPLLDHLLAFEACDRILVFDNGSKDETWTELEAMEDEYPQVEPLLSVDRGLYAMWNEALQIAKAYAEWCGSLVDLVIANNDIRLPAGSLGKMSDHLRERSDVVAVSPDPNRSAASGIAARCSTQLVSGSYRHGGLLGWCFMVKAEDPRVTPFDEGFGWWAGDDDAFLTWEHKNNGRLARVLGVGCDHVGSGTASDGSNGWTETAKGRDHERFEAKWGAGSGW